MRCLQSKSAISATEVELAHVAPVGGDGRARVANERQRARGTIIVGGEGVVVARVLDDDLKVGRGQVLSVVSADQACRRTLVTPNSPAMKLYAVFSMRFCDSVRKTGRTPARVKLVKRWPSAQLSPAESGHAHKVLNCTPAVKSCTGQRSNRRAPSDLKRPKLEQELGAEGVLPRVEEG